MLCSHNTRPLFRRPAAAVALVLLGLAAAAPVAVAAEGSTGGAYAAITADYEAIRQALIADGVAGVAERAGSLAETARGLAADFDAEHAGVAGEAAEQASALLPEIAAAADAVAEAEGLVAVRDAFYELTKPLVRFNALVDGERPAVAYCPMAQRSWLQPAEDEIGNPYYGESMLHCGSLVDN